MGLGTEIRNFNVYISVTSLRGHLNNNEKPPITPSALLEQNIGHVTQKLKREFITFVQFLVKVLFVRPVADAKLWGLCPLNLGKLAFC